MAALIMALTTCLRITGQCSKQHRIPQISTSITDSIPHLSNHTLDTTNFRDRSEEIMEISGWARDDGYEDTLTNTEVCHCHSLRGYGEDGTETMTLLSDQQRLSYL